MGRRKKNEKGYPAAIDTVASIAFVRQEDVYDIEMADPTHNFVTGSGIVTSNSHAVCVALDSLYGAFAKAHYPYEYYTSL